MFGKKSDSWLIVGLGNPGKEYERTRHNAGFRAIDALAESLGCKIDKGKFQGLYGQCNYNGGKVYLLKPLTYMNLSGRSVLQLSSYFNIPPRQVRGKFSRKQFGVGTRDVQIDILLDPKRVDGFLPLLDIADFV